MKSSANFLGGWTRNVKQKVLDGVWGAILSYELLHVWSQQRNKGEGGA